MRTLASDQVSLCLSCAHCWIVLSVANSTTLQIFLFNLLWFSAARFPLAMRYLLTLCYRQATNDSSSQGRALSWSASLGPDFAQSQTSNKAASYGVFVLVRALDQPDKVWDERIRLYKEGLASAPWNKIPSLRSRSGDETKRDDGSKVRCSTTVIFGLEDRFLDPRIVVEGFQDFIDTESSFKGLEILLKDVGHWSPTHPECVRILEQALILQLQRERTNTERQFAFAYSSAMQLREFR